MPGKTTIEWTNRLGNPVSGSAEAISLRFGHIKKPWTHPCAEENVKVHPERLDAPRRWRTPQRVFVNSRSDLFHPLVPDGFIAWVWLTMARTPQHTYQILTKRPERMRDWVRRWNDLSGEPCDPRMVRGPEATRATHPSGRGQLFAAYLDELGKTVPVGEPLPGAWPTFDWMEGPRWWPRLPLPNVWLGTSVEDQRAADERIPHLIATPAAVRFLSCEPLLGPVDLRRWLGVPCTHRAQTNPLADRVCPMCGERGMAFDSHLQWVIVGGESGPRHRPFNSAWAADIRDQCHAAGVAFFFRQWGGRAPKAGGRLLNGRIWDEMPTPATEAGG